MKIKRPFARNLSWMIIAIMVMTTFSGCIAKNNTTTPKAAKVSLVYYKLFDDEDVITPLIQQYTTQHPNVEITYRKFTDPVEYENLIINELAEGEGPDIFSAPNYWFLRNAKKISPMPTTKMSPAQFEETFVSVAKNDLVLRDAADGKDKVFGIPLTVDTLALYYNRGTYEDKIPSRGRPAETWEGLKDDVFKLSKKDQSFERFELAGIAMGRSDNIARAVDILYMLMLQYKINFYNDNVSQAQFAKQSSITATGVSLNPATEALKLYTSFALPANKNYSWNQYLADPKSSTKEMDTFARGKVAMIFGYSYLYQQILSQVKDLKSKGVQTIDEQNIRISAVPQVNDPTTSTEKRVAFANYYAETVSRTSANPDVAWDFLLFISSKDNLKFYNEKTHNPTSRRDMIDDQTKDPIYGVFAQQIGYAESFPIYDAARYSQIFSAAIDAVLATQSAQDAIRTAETAINTILPAEGLIPALPKAATTPAKTTKTTQQSSSAAKTTTTTK
jgi:ABC-type glycerol-3-phosphate transport system substrate-binding protein